MMVARSGDEETVVECKVCALKTLEELGKIRPQVVLQRVSVCMGICGRIVWCGRVRESDRERYMTLSYMSL